MDGQTAVFFEGNTISPDEIEIARILKARTNLVLGNVISGKYRADDPEILNIDLDLLLFFQPRQYIGKDSAEIGYIQSYENLVASIGKWLGYNPAGFSTLRFYQTLQIAKQAQKQKTVR